jgi:hypothetical protein
VDRSTCGGQEHGRVAMGLQDALEGNALYPVEFKKTASPSKNALWHFKILHNLERNIGPGAVVCLKESVVPLSSEVVSIPISCIG